MSFHTTPYLLVLLLSYLFCYHIIYTSKNNTYLSVPPIYTFQPLALAAVIISAVTLLIESIFVINTVSLLLVFTLFHNLILLTLPPF